MKTDWQKEIGPFLFVLFFLASVSSSPATAAPSDQGMWDPQLYWTFGSGFIAVHMIHLAPVNPSNHVAPGKLLIWGFDHNEEQPRQTKARVFEPADPSVQQDEDSLTGWLEDYPSEWIYCAGHALLPDGKAITIGGNDSRDRTQDPEFELGIKNTYLFDLAEDPTESDWIEVAMMDSTRWYPTATLLPDGRILSSQGTRLLFDDWACPMECQPECPQECLVADYDAIIQTIPEVYSPRHDQWSLLPDADSAEPSDWDGEPYQWYPALFVAPNGKIFAASPQSRYLDPISWLWDSSNLDEYFTTDMGVEWARPAVMYEPGKIMTCGGKGSNDEDPATDMTLTIDLNDPNPIWDEAGNMTEARRHHDLVLLPDGRVLAVGGALYGGYGHPDVLVYLSEVFDPATGSWSEWESMNGDWGDEDAHPRTYHSTASLLPDGRVIVAGGQVREDPDDPESGYDCKSAQIFSPPYLFHLDESPVSDGERPQFDEVPDALVYGEDFAVSYLGDEVEKVALVGLAAVTHAFDENQRYVPLTIKTHAYSSGDPGEGSLTIDMVDVTANIAPPTDYMLFLAPLDFPWIEGYRMVLAQGSS